MRNQGHLQLRNNYKIKATCQPQMQHYNSIKSNQLNDQDTNQMYANQTYQSQLNYSGITNNRKYAQQVQANFGIELSNLTYQQIQLSTTAMRDMLKKLSHILDFKLHQNYGMMGVTVIKPEKDVQKIINILKQEKQANAKLIQTQISQIKNIEVVDQQMASNKRVQIQAQKLRELRKIKRQMIQSEKQSRYNRGEISKAGDYLARDLDSQKLNFRLNKIKQDIQYMLVKQRSLIEQQNILDDKSKQMQAKNQQMRIIFEQNVKIAQTKNLAVSANISYMSKKIKFEALKKQIDHKKKNLQILTYNTKHTAFISFKEVQQLKKTINSLIEKQTRTQQKVIQLKIEITQKVQKNKLEQKLDQSMIIKNIQTLLKKKNQKLASQLNVQSAPTYIQLSANTMSESVLLKPNFKIKPFLLNSSRANNKSGKFDKLQKLDNSLDLKQKKPNIFIRKSYSKQKSNVKQKGIALNQQQQSAQQQALKKILSNQPLTLTMQHFNQETVLREQQFKKKQNNVEQEIKFEFDD